MPIIWLGTMSQWNRGLRREGAYNSVNGDNLAKDDADGKKL